MPAAVKTVPVNIMKTIARPAAGTGVVISWAGPCTPESASCGLELKIAFVMRYYEINKDGKMLQLFRLHQIDKATKNILRIFQPLLDLWVHNAGIGPPPDQQARFRQAPD